MLADRHLEQWVRNPEVFRRSEAGINAFASRWNDGNVNRRIAESVGTVADPSAEQVADSIEKLFENHDWSDALIEALIEEMRRDPFFVPPFRHLNSDIHQGLIIYEDSTVSIALGVSGAAQLAAKKSGPRAAASIAFSGQMSVLKFVRGGGSKLSFWEAPRIDGRFSRSTAGRCRKTGECEVKDGRILRVDGRYQSFVIEHALTNMLILQATVKPDQAPLSVEYDSSSHEYVGCSAADDSASRVQMIATLLRKLDCAEAFPVLAAFLDNPNFYVRWHMMRELLGIDAQAALPLLQRMAESDPHEDTKRAARSVLGSLSLRKAA